MDGTQIAYGRILIVDDDPQILRVVGEALRRKGYTVETASDGVHGLKRARAEEFDLIILDVLLPKIDGLQVCTELRKSHNTPILMLSGLDDDVDKILGLEMGADDYLTKPFSSKELLARVRALLRRVQRLSQPESREQPQKLGPFELDRAALELSIEGDPVPLTTLEFRIMECLLAHLDQVLTRGRLVERVWGLDAPSDERVVDSHIRNIRRKLPHHTQFIESVRGVGYRLRLH